MDELDGDSGDDRRLRAGWRRQVHEQRPQPLPAGRKRLCPDFRNDTAVRPDRELQTFLELP